MALFKYCPGLLNQHEPTDLGEYVRMTYAIWDKNGIHLQAISLWVSLNMGVLVPNLDEAQRSEIHRTSFLMGPAGDSVEITAEKVRRYTEPQEKDTSEGKSHISSSLPGQEGLVLNVEFKEDDKEVPTIASLECPFFGSAEISRGQARTLDEGGVGNMTVNRYSTDTFHSENYHG